MYAAKDAGAVRGLSLFDCRRGSVHARSVTIDGLAAGNVGEAGPSERKGSDAAALTDGAVAVSDGDSRRSVEGLRGGGCARW